MTQRRQNDKNQPLASIEAENAVLGALLIDPFAIVRVSGKLLPTHFWREKNRWIYQTLVDMYANAVAIDMLTVCDALEAKGLLGQIGGPAYITGLTTETPTSVHAEHYAKIVIDLARRRALSDLAARLAAAAHDKSKDIADILALADKAYYSVTADLVDSNLLSSKQLMDELYTEIEEAMQRKGILGVPTGLGDVDDLMGGLHKSDLIYLAARPAVGKTSAALNLALNATKADKRTLIISLEMSALQLAQRMACIVAGLPVRKLRRGELEQNDWPKLLQAMDFISRLPLHIVWSGTSKPSELRATVRKHQVEHGLDLLIVDYVQLMTADDERGNRREQVDSISRNLKLLAKDLDVPLVACAQVGRGVEARVDKRPVLADLRESGALEQDADQVIFLYRPEMYEQGEEFKGIMEWIVAKNRNGPTGTALLIFRGYNNQVVGTKVVQTDGGMQIRMPLDEVPEHLK